MKNFQVLGRVAQVNAGRVKLNDDQARRRRHLIKPVGNGVYEVLKPIQFKHGEQFGYNGEFPKAMAEEVMTPEQIKADADKKAREEKKAKARAEAAEAERQKAAEKDAAEKTAAMESAVQNADAAVIEARKAVDTQKGGIDQAVNAEIERIIGDMAEFADAGDIQALKDATAALRAKVEHLTKKK